MTESDKLLRPFDFSEDEKRKNDSRLRIYYVRDKDILQIFNGHRNTPSTLHLYTFSASIDDVPEGYELTQVHHDYQRGAIAFILRHPSFDPVPEGRRIPVFGDIPREIVFQTVHLRKDGLYEVALASTDPNSPVNTIGD